MLLSLQVGLIGTFSLNRINTDIWEFRRLVVLVCNGGRCICAYCCASLIPVYATSTDNIYTIDGPCLVHRNAHHITGSSYTESNQVSSRPNKS